MATDPPLRNGMTVFFFFFFFFFACARRLRSCSAATGNAPPRALVVNDVLLQPTARAQQALLQVLVVERRHPRHAGIFSLCLARERGEGKNRRPSR
mmetsp:Transcript_3295/g.2581  ORF Transcript_3295/g.2581 Transcript_3295/m.2581 type:complete len:96 (-) Transcript_3295:240-527(-)